VFSVIDDASDLSIEDVDLILAHQDDCTPPNGSITVSLVREKRRTLPGRRVYLRLV
jgi:hypothetical protein